LDLTWQTLLGLLKHNLPQSHGLLLGHLRLVAAVDPSLQVLLLDRLRLRLRLARLSHSFGQPTSIVGWKKNVRGSVNL
jgi:hypothetical protein